MTALSLQTVDLSKRFGSFTALDAVSMKVQPGTVHALLGENGAGKRNIGLRSFDVSPFARPGWRIPGALNRAARALISSPDAEHKQPEMPTQEAATRPAGIKEAA